MDNYTYLIYDMSDTDRKDEVNTKPMSGKNIFFIAVVAVTIGAGLIFLLSKENVPEAQEPAETITNSVSEYPAIVAKVNDEEITSAELTAQVAQVTKTASQQGADLDDPSVTSEIVGFALTSLVNTKLLLQSAVNAGVVSTEEEITAQIEILVEQAGGDEAFQTYIESIGLTHEEVRVDIGNQITIDSFLKQSIDAESLTVTDEEVATFYDQIVESGQEVPPLAEVELQIRQQLLQQAQQSAINEFVESLRVGANIQILI